MYSCSAIFLPCLYGGKLMMGWRLIALCWRNSHITSTTLVTGYLRLCWVSTVDFTKSYLCKWIGAKAPGLLHNHDTLMQWLRACIIMNCCYQIHKLYAPISTAGGWCNIKTSYQYRKSHCGDKTIVRLSYLHNGITYTDKMSSLYWTRVQMIWSSGWHTPTWGLFMLAWYCVVIKDVWSMALL